ncbi:MAG: adenylyltransferase/cytidyltransferase family protein [Candidatus Arcticimaribacter sp.]
MKKIWVNGCFDVLHLGHVRMLEFAKSLGGNLVVGIDSDTRVSNLKGEDRPINNQLSRSEFLVALRSVDSVAVFDSKCEMRKLLKTHRITDMVVGEEYKGKEITGEDLVKRIHFFPRVGDFSTTKILKGSNR